MRLPAVFLDRDGVINENRADYVKDWHEFVFLPGSLSALRCLAELPWPIVVVSNQSVVGRRLVSVATLADIHERMTTAVREAGGRIDAVYCCPHSPDAGCSCRKPLPGLLNQARDDLSLDLTKSVLVGDALSDVQAARAAGCLPLLVKTGRGEDAAARLLRASSLQVLAFADLAEAAGWLVEVMEAGWAPWPASRPRATAALVPAI